MSDDANYCYVFKILEVGLLLGLMCKYACEECDFRIFGNDQFVKVSLTSTSILEGVKALRDEVLGKVRLELSIVYPLSVHCQSIVSVCHLSLSSNWLGLFVVDDQYSYGSDEVSPNGYAERPCAGQLYTYILMVRLSVRASLDRLRDIQTQKTDR